MGNRFMWVPGQRKHVPIPDPPEPDPALWDPLAARLRESFNYWLERKQTRTGDHAAGCVWQVYCADEQIAREPKKVRDRCVL